MLGHLDECKLPQFRKKMENWASYFPIWNKLTFPFNGRSVHTSSSSSCSSNSILFGLIDITVAQLVFSYMLAILFIIVDNNYKQYVWNLLLT